MRARPTALEDWTREPLEVRRLLAIGAEIDTALEPAEVPNPQGPMLSARRAELADIEIEPLCDALQRVCEVFAQREAA